MSLVRLQPGLVRDAIFEYLRNRNGSATVGEICAGVRSALGRPVPDSSIRSYLNLNAPATFCRTGHGRYELTNRTSPFPLSAKSEARESAMPSLTLYEPAEPNPVFQFGRATLKI